MIEMLWGLLADAEKALKQSIVIKQVAHAQASQPVFYTFDKAIRFFSLAMES